MGELRRAVRARRDEGGQDGSLLSGAVALCEVSPRRSTVVGVQRSRRLLWLPKGQPQGLASPQGRRSGVTGTGRLLVDRPLVPSEEEATHLCGLLVWVGVRVRCIRLVPGAFVLLGDPIARTVLHGLRSRLIPRALHQQWGCLLVRIWVLACIGVPGRVQLQVLLGFEVLLRWGVRAPLHVFLRLGMISAVIFVHVLLSGQAPVVVAGLGGTTNVSTVQRHQRVGSLLFCKSMWAGGVSPLVNGLVLTVRLPMWPGALFGMHLLGSPFHVPVLITSL
mmetsp:Transcript_132979/g.230608  ORF Transcript_132979/g.230608 Transcript_132979/m.230608 type:complete len:277 (-) Transcript_132979:2178-3008(-)